MTACSMCEWGHPRIQGEHFTTRGERLERCTAPDADRPGPPEFPFRERFESWRARVAEMGKLPMPTEEKASARRLVATHLARSAEVEREPGCDDGD